MDFEETQDAYELFRIDPMLVCSCDEFHICQVCDYIYQQEKKRKDGPGLSNNNQDRK
jgi:hypothetical protein